MQNHPILYSNFLSEEERKKTKEIKEKEDAFIKKYRSMNTGSLSEKDLKKYILGCGPDGGIAKFQIERIEDYRKVEKEKRHEEKKNKKNKKPTPNTENYASSLLRPSPSQSTSTVSREYTLYLENHLAEQKRIVEQRRIEEQEQRRRKSLLAVADLALADSGLADSAPESQPITTKKNDFLLDLLDAAEKIKSSEGNPSEVTKISDSQLLVKSKKIARVSGN
jgi:hypothetical protein